VRKTEQGGAGKATYPAEGQDGVEEMAGRPPYFFCLPRINKVLVRMTAIAAIAL
jgi:hypothetical protein